MPNLRTHNLKHAYGRTISLTDINLDCASRSITCLLGPSGCGKSTLLRCLAGHERIASGSIFLGDTCLAGDGLFMPPEARRIGMVFQDYALFPHLKVWQNVAFGLQHLPTRAHRAAAVQALDMFGLADLADRYPHTCSGGQQQRVALARSLAPQPKVLLLDEPFSGLDANLREALSHELPRVLHEAGMTTVMVTHDPQEALACADHIVLLREGCLIQAGTPDDLWYRPIDLQTMMLFGNVQCFNASIKNRICSSALGTWPCQQPDGHYQLAIRSEAFYLGEAGVQGRIIGSSVLASQRLLDIKLPDDRVIHIHANTRDKVESTCTIGVDLRLIAYFPKSTDGYTKPRQP